MVEVWERQELPDVSVKCGGEVFRCHNLVFAARSPVFKARFETSVKDAGEIVWFPRRELKPSLLGESQLS